VATLATSEFTQAHTGFMTDFIFPSGISGTSGHIKLLNAEKVLVDALGYGTATHPEAVNALAPAANKILQRQTVTGNLLKDTNNNSVDFLQTVLVLQNTTGLFEEQGAIMLEDARLKITELLPDVAGTDSGKEFIELYNPLNRSVSLKDYQLQVGPGYTKSYPLPDLTIEPGSYFALYDTQTGITLPNTSATLRLIAPNGDLIEQTEPYDSLGEDVSWTYMDDIWQPSLQPTPGLQNIIKINEADDPNVSIVPAIVTACQAGQERNPATGRCRKIVNINSIACKPGQIKNPETNRCRNITSVLSNLLPCKVGQNRNPETGRCRNNMTPTAAKACPAGQEKNPQTNRCRKTSTNIKMDGVKDLPIPLVTNSAKWWFAGLAASGSTGYAIYEWRRDLLGFLLIIKTKLLPGA